MAKNQTLPPNLANLGRKTVPPEPTPAPPPPLPQQEPPAPPEVAEVSKKGEGSQSRFFAAISAILNLILFLLLATSFVLFVLTLDFLDILQFRYKVPQSWREKKPLSIYYDFVKLHQMPHEERLNELIIREKGRYDNLMTEGNADLKRRARELENSYRDLVRNQEEFYRKKQEEVLSQQVNLEKEKARLEKLDADLTARKAALASLAQEIASEATNVESSLIRFMEEENRLKPVQEMTSSMDPRSVAEMFDEIADSKLVYDIIKGIPPERSALILSFMDPEKAGKIMKMSTVRPKLPDPGSRSYVPKKLKDIVASAQENLQ